VRVAVAMTMVVPGLTMLMADKHEANQNSTDREGEE